MPDTSLITELFNALGVVIAERRDDGTLAVVGPWLAELYPEADSRPAFGSPFLVNFLVDAEAF